jgi:hypothetical protein
LARAVARAGAVGGAAIPRRAYQRYLHILETRMVKIDQRQAHECGHTCESRQVHAGHGLKERITSHLFASKASFPRSQPVHCASCNPLRDTIWRETALAFIRPLTAWLA